MASRPQRLIAVGDIILGPDPETFFASVAPILRTADIVAGQLEVPYTTRDAAAMAHGRDPETLYALVSAGFHIVTLAGNHCMDAGIPGIEDTLTWLREHRIASVGVGMNLAQAKRPAVLEREGTRYGFLDYNCVGPKETWAAANKPGCAYVHIITHYELDHATPGGPPTIYTWAEPGTLDGMVHDIRQLRVECEILVVALHKGLGHTPIKLAAYERQVAHAAIDAGADLVVGHHAHILRGVEWYRGKPIFHGLGNFVTWVPSLAPKAGQDAQDWATRRRELFGFEPDPEYPTYPFHPEAKYSIMAQCLVRDGNIAEVGYTPLLVNKQAQPEVLSRETGGQVVFDYIAKITSGAGLDARFRWKGDAVIVEPT